MGKNFITIILLSLLTINLTGCTSSNDSEINSAPISDDYYISIKSDYYDINSGSKNGYIYTKNKEKVAKITYMNRDGAIEYINLIKTAQNTNILDIAQNETQTSGYYFFTKETEQLTYNYIFVFPHTAALVESVVSKEKTKQILLNIDISENESSNNYIPYYYYYYYILN